MPLYDYECKSCGHRFEALVLKNTPSCPECSGADLDQLISLFAVDSESTRHSNLQRARRDNAKVARDKKIADAEYIRNHDH